MKPVSGSNIRSAISLAQIMQRVIASGKITRADELIFWRAATSETQLSEEDMKLLQGVLKRMELGLIKVED